MKSFRPISSRSARRPGSGFTLTELLVVMGIVIVLATLTVVGVRGIARSARLASATNSVMAALDNARALAMKTNTIVLVVFRPRFEGPRTMVVEAVVAKWTGESYPTSGGQVIDRFVPLHDVGPRTLPVGIKVAGPDYRSSLSGVISDDIWLTQAHLPAINQETALLGEQPGAMIGVMYAPDGSTITRNSQSDSARAWVDFIVDPDPLEPPTIQQFGTPYDTTDAAITFEQWWEDDEVPVTIVPFLAVYNDDQAREFRTTEWTTLEDYAELTGATGYISEFADRIHFNRYTGVAMK